MGRIGVGGGIALAVFVTGLSGPARAQVVFDDTLTAAGEAPLDPGGTTWQIDPDRGATVSNGDQTNLFYSFERFDVPAAHAAEFRPGADVDAIVSRVTGGDLSRIDGDVRVSAIGGGAGPDLFLVNPAGVLFGGDTRIDMNGAFRVSTASSVGFADGGFFSARDAAAPLPAAASAPSLLRFDGGPSGEVRIEGRLISDDVGGARDASVVSLVARDVTARGPGLIAAEQATLELGAVGARAIDVPLDLRDAALGPGTAAGGKIEIAAGTAAALTVTTQSPNPDQGRIVIRGGELVLVNGALLAGGDGAAGADSMAIDVAVADRVSLTGSFAKIESLSGRTFGPGSLRIRAGRLEITDAGSVEISSTRGNGVPGRLEIDVDSLRIEGANSRIRSLTRAVGAGGDIDLRARTIRLADGALVFSESQASTTTAIGAVGDVAVTAESVELVDGARILSVTNDAGAGGDVTLDADSLSLLGQASVTAGSTTDAVGGDLRIEVGRLALGGSSAIGTGSVSPVPQGAAPITGPGGAVGIVADSVRVDGGSQISTSTDGAGDAGDLVLDVRDDLVLSGRLGLDQPSGLFARSGRAFGSGATGDGGRIVVRAGSLVVDDGAQINSTTVGTGRAGGIDVETVGELELDGGRVRAIASGVGETGDVRLAAGGRLRVRGGAEIVSEAPVPLPGPGLPGDPPTAGGIVLVAGDRVLVEGARIATDSARPESGDVRIEATRGISLVDSSVTTNVDAASGRGGDVVLDTQALVLADALVTANADGTNADAGNVTLRAGAGLLQSTDSVVEARAALGVSGVVVRATPDTNLPEELGRLAAAPRTDDGIVVGSCVGPRSTAGTFARTAAPVAVDSPERLLPEPAEVDPAEAAPAAAGAPASGQDRDACPAR